jgi:hypothetical protein
MVHSVDSKSMTQRQISLVEYALRQVSRIEESDWDKIPLALHPSFAKYMCRDIWTDQSDPLTLREAALMVIRDAITHTGEFGNEE